MTISDSVWAAWLALFLILELLGLFHVVPWTTLSDTARLNEETYPWLRTVLFGFLIGLGVHIRYPVSLWSATAGGILAAIAINFFWT